MKSEKVVEKAIEILKNSPNVTSLDVKNELRQEFPNEDWSQDFVGASLRASEKFIVLDNSNGYNVYAIQETKSGNKVLNFIKNLF